MSRAGTLRARTIPIVLALLAGRGAAAPRGGTAEGTVSLDGRPVSLRYAYVTEPSTLEVDLSNVPLDRSRIKRLIWEAPASDAVVVAIQVRQGDRRATSVTIHAPGLPVEGIHPKRVGTFSAETVRADLVVASLEHAGTQAAEGHEVSWSFRFRALPPDTGGIRSFDDALDRMPMLRGLLDRANETFGRLVVPAVITLFVGLVALALVWGKVLAPRRARRILARLEAQGYLPLDAASPEVASALEIAPFALEPTVRFPEGTRTPLQAVERSGSHGRRTVATLFLRWQDMANVGTGPGRNSATWQTIAVESVSLPLRGELCIRQRDIKFVSPEREARFGFHPVETPDLLPAFAERYTVFGKGEVPALPRELQQAFVDVAPVLLATLRGSFPNTRFGPRGWGICASNVWLDEPRLRALLDAADRIGPAAEQLGRG